ncbi:glucan endo-1,3-alpha-glucosidase, partial [Lecanoromycetidae sp. Uapishka_2]
MLEANHNLIQIGITDDRTSASDYDADMQQANAAGIDAFALNIGLDGYTETQLDYAYDSAAKNNMSVFISFDFNWTPFASGKSKADSEFIKAWPNNGNNKAPDGTNLTVSDGDTDYTVALGTKPYMAPVAAWFSTHFGPELKGNSKNWVFPSDSLWYDRWTEVLNLDALYLEIITWNDYGESHYVGPLNSPHIDDGNSKWTNDMPHDGFLSMAKPYIKAFKTGAKTVNTQIDSDQLIYWYRPTLKSADCDSTDNCEQPVSPPENNYFIGKPNGYDTMQDAVFVVALLTSPGTVQVTSGTNSQSFNANAGPNIFQLNMGTGKQSFSLTRGGQTVLCGDSPKDIIDECVCGIYNFNAFVGTLPPGPSDSLQADGLKSFTVAMQATCQATPSLGAPSSVCATQPAATGTVSGPGSGPAVTGSSSASSTAGSGSTTATTSASSSSLPVNFVPPINPITTATSVTAAGGGSLTITALSQLAPTNCLHSGFVW